MEAEDILTWAEAVSVLELTPPANADVVRRAYLRRVKKVRPERDPEGFQRLRCAYEMLREGVFEDEYECEYGYEDAHAVLGEEGHDDAMAASIVGSPGPHMDANVDTLRDAYDEYVEDDDDGYNAISDQIWEFSSEAHEAAEAGDLDRARSNLEAALELAETHRASEGLGLHAVLTTVLWLYAKEHIKAAKTCFRRYYALLERTGTSFQLLNPNLGGHALLLREMRDIPDDVPSPFHAAIARGIIDDDPFHAADILDSLADVHVLAAINLSEYLDTRAPTLNELYGNTLRKATKTETTTRSLWLAAS